MTKRYLFYLSALIFLVGLFQSCVDLEVEKQYIADAYVITKIVGTDTLYAVESYVNSNTVMTDVTMKNPDGSKVVDLNKFTAGYFDYAGNDSSFTTQVPPSGNYAFTITFDDETTATTVDKLTADVADVVTVKNVVPNEEGGSLDVAWQKNRDADLYIIKIMKKNSIIFSSGFIDSTYSSATIYAYSNGWATNANPHGGDSLDVVISGVIRDKTQTDYTKFQSISQSFRTPFIWVE